MQNSLANTLNKQVGQVKEGICWMRSHLRRGTFYKDWLQSSVFVKKKLYDIVPISIEGYLDLWIRISSYSQVLSDIVPISIEGYLDLWIRISSYSQVLSESHIYKVIHEFLDFKSCSVQCNSLIYRATSNCNQGLGFVISYDYNKLFWKCNRVEMNWNAL